MANVKDTTLEMDSENVLFSQGSEKISPESLEFHDIPHDETLEGKSQTHTFKKFPDDATISDEEDQTDLLEGGKKQPSFWKFEYYQQFFDVDTYQVLRRILGSMYPHPRSKFLQQKIRPNPDMYGPFWICTTLVFTTAIAGNMANYIQYAGKDYQWKYDFHKVTFAATAIFSYWWVIPTLVYGLLLWRGSQAGITFLEIICIYGYSLAIYIPISILWVIQINWLQWLLVFVGMVLSGGVLLLTFWPAVKHDDKKVAYITMGFIFLFHGLLAVGFVLYFFHVPVHSPTPVGQITNTTIIQKLVLPSGNMPQSALSNAPLQNVIPNQPSGIQGGVSNTVQNTGQNAIPVSNGEKPNNNLEKQLPGSPVETSNVQIPAARKK